MAEDDSSVQYRRMSLKDFTGLESRAPKTKVYVALISCNRPLNLFNQHKKMIPCGFVNGCLKLNSAA